MHFGTFYGIRVVDKSFEFIQNDCPKSIKWMVDTFLQICAMNKQVVLICDHKKVSDWLTFCYYAYVLFNTKLTHVFCIFVAITTFVAPVHATLCTGNNTVPETLCTYCFRTADTNGKSILNVNFTSVAFFLSNKRHDVSLYISWEEFSSVHHSCNYY